MGPRTMKSTLASLALSLLLVAACGNDGGEDRIPMTGNRPTTTAEATTTTEPPADEGTFPVDVQGANGTITIEERPEAIVSLSPTATEMVFAIDAGDQVVAVDDQSDFPEEAPRTDLSGVEPNVEAIASEEPDLVLVADDKAISELEALDITVLHLPPAGSLDDSYSQIQELGKATGHVGAAEELVTEMRSRIDELVGQVPEDQDPIRVYHEVDAELFTVTASSFIGQIYELARLENIAARLPGGPFPKISPEEVVTANPQWIFLAYGGDSEIAQVRSRPGWNQIAAVQNDQIMTLDPAIASRWGPRTVVLLETIMGAVEPPT